MRFDQHELETIADQVAKAILPRLLAELRRTPQQTAEPNGHMLNVHQLAERFDLSENTVRSRVADGTFPHIRAGRRILFDPAAVLEALRPKEDTGT